MLTSTLAAKFRYLSFDTLMSKGKLDTLIIKSETQ